MAADPAPGVPAPLLHRGTHAAAGMPGHGNANGQHNPSGYAPGPYAGGHHDVPGYPPTGYLGLPDAPAYPPDAPAYPPDGTHSAGQQAATRYPPPEFYGQGGYGGETRP